MDLPRTEHEDAAPPGVEREVTSTMSIVDRVRRRRMINRENRALDRAWQSAPTQAMRDEIAIFAQRKTF